MCLLVFAWKMHPGYDLILAANRDEFYNRPARSAPFRDEKPDLLAGMDNLIAGNKNAIWYYSNIQDIPSELGPGIYGLSNHLLDTPWPKVEKAKATLAAIIASDEPTHEKLFRLLYDRTHAPDNQLPDTGLDRSTEKKLSSAFIDIDGYGTRSSTLIMLKKNGQLEFRERVYQNDNAGAPGDSYFRFLLPG